MTPTNQEPDSGEKLARLFHDTYERLAPDFGYETRQDTKEFDPSSPNGKLMIAVANEVATHYAAKLKEAELRGRELELAGIPWKRSDKYGINSPYVTKKWLTERKAALQQELASLKKEGE